MADDLPYRAEYSKSGRASCKGCKSQIAKDSLRLAVLTQSAFFDGKEARWYHFMCFFGKQRPKTVGEIAHFESLRWEDQEKIRKKIESGAGGDADLPKGKGKKRAAGAASALKDFTVEYAKSSRAACKGCEEKIMKEEVRISKKDFESEIGKMYGGQERWHHVDCFVKRRVELEFWDSGASLPGFKTLSKDDQQMVKQKLPEMAKVKKEDEADGVSPTKKAKVEEDEGELKKQNKIMFKYRDQLKAQLKKKDLAELLEHNNQAVPPGTEAVLDRLADLMTFGRLKPCKECGEGQLVFRSGVGYQCLGNLTEWSKCGAVNLEPERERFTVPDELKKFDFLNSYKSVLRKRIIRLAAPSTSTSSTPVAPVKIERAAPPLKNMEFVLLKTTKPKDELKKEIVKLGGKVVTKITPQLAAVISTPEEVEKMGKRMEEVKKCDIQVVSEDFLDEVRDGGALVLINKKNICTWGSDPRTRIVVKDETNSKSQSGGKSKSMFTKSMPSKVKLKLKGGTAVDPDSALDEVSHVYQQNGEIYNAVLGITDIQAGKNSYYKIQVLESDKLRHGHHQYWVFRSWGRIGTTIGGNKLDDMSSKQDAVASFKSLYEEKTGNSWGSREYFQKVPGRMYPIDVDYGNKDDENLNKMVSNVESKLPKPVQDLVTLLFDVDTMKKVMMEFELDLEKMPLGKLSHKQLTDAYSVLKTLQELVSSGAPNARYIDASNRFYTLIPHDFGVDNPPVLNTEDMIKQKVDMVDSLMEIEIAYNLLKSSDEDSSDMHPIDAHFMKLKIEIEVVDRDSDEFALLEKYVKNTHAETHSQYELEILEVFRVKRQNEDKRYKPFKKLPNRKLLWHGSRVTNFAGILSQGLRIAPPEAPVTGYMFGKGIYFADMVSKSANYCCTNKSNPVGILLLCEVALGNMQECSQAKYFEKLPKGKHSVKGLGRTEPDPNEIVKRPDGVEVPVGRGVNTKRTDVSLLYNEYIVYDVAQVNIQYLFKMNFKYKY